MKKIKFFHFVKEFVLFLFLFFFLHLLRSLYTYIIKLENFVVYFITQVPDITTIKKICFYISKQIHIKKNEFFCYCVEGLQIFVHRGSSNKFNVLVSRRRIYHNPSTHKSNAFSHYVNLFLSIMKAYFS